MRVRIQGSGLSIQAGLCLKEGCSIVLTVESRGVDLGTCGTDKVTTQQIKSWRLGDDNFSSQASHKIGLQ